MNDLFGNPILEREMPGRHEGRARIAANGVKRYDIPRGYAYPPGTGPAGEKCGTCKFACSSGGGRKTYYKCLHLKPRWTAGPGTDIRLKSPACKLWAKKEDLKQ